MCLDYLDQSFQKAFDIRDDVVVFGHSRFDVADLRPNRMFTTHQFQVNRFTFFLDVRQRR